MENCIFCKIANKEIPGKIVYEDDLCLAFLDLSQTTNGHTLVVPKTHYQNILDVDKEVLSHLIKVTKKLTNQIITNLDAKGANVLTNANEVAGQTVMHFHIHIIPRYNETDQIKIDFTDRSQEVDLDNIFNKIFRLHPAELPGKRTSHKIIYNILQMKMSLISCHEHLWFYPSVPPDVMHIKRAHDTVQIFFYTKFPYFLDQ